MYDAMGQRDTDTNCTEFKTQSIRTETKKI